jgi:hypothetical protein
MGGAAAGTIAQTANRLDLVPFWTPVTFSIDRVAVNVTTGVAGSNMRVLIYSANANGTPNSKLFESGNLSCATNNTFPEETVSFTFTANTLYWVGTHASATQTMRSLQVQGLVALGLAGATGTSDACTLRTSPTYGSAPATFTYSAANLTSAAVPMVRMRIA